MSDTISINEAVNANSGVSPTAAPGDTSHDQTIYSGTVSHVNILSLSFTCSLVNAHSNANQTQVYVKLKGANGSSHDLIIPMTVGQTVSWSPNPGLKDSSHDVNNQAFTIGSGNAMFDSRAIGYDITSITVTPDPTSDVVITGSISISA